MPLSEYEQRVLEQMEQQLSSDDPKLAGSFAPRPARPGVRYALAGAAVVVGAVLLVVGVGASLPIVGILGFAVMFGGVAYALAKPTPKAGPIGAVAADGSVSARKKSKRRGGQKRDFMSRLEDRWDRRRDQGL